MWKSFEIDADFFILKVNYENNNLKVTISDLKSVWREELSSIDIIERFKEMNPSFACNEEINKSIFPMINNVNEAMEKNVELKDNTMILNIKSQLDKGYKIKFRLVLEELPGKEFFSEITLPMIQTISNLERSENVLYYVIKRKDRELQEYKLEKGEISRDDLKSEPFDFDKIGKTLDNNLMLQLFMKKFSPDVTKENSETGDSKTKTDIVRKKPLKRKIYSARNSNKKAAL